MPHIEHHRSQRAPWLRAAVLGANDGIISTASLMMGMAAAQDNSSFLLAGIAGTIAGAISMAAGEYVSVYSQADIEKADLMLEKKALLNDPESELLELKDIYIARGLSDALALEVAQTLTQHDALAAHARDELGFTDDNAANPLQAALTSALSFIAGAAVPLLAGYIKPNLGLIVLPLISLVALAILGGLAAYLGGASKIKGALRVTFWGFAAMLITALAGKWVGLNLG